MRPPLREFVSRFQVAPSDEWFRSQLAFAQPEQLPVDSDPALLLHTLRTNLEGAIYVPTAEGVRIARWIYDITRGFAAYRYQSIERYVDVAMALPGELHHFCAPEAVPVYLIDGLPGYGKSALVRALGRVIPPEVELTAEGDPPQRIRALSTLYVRVNKNFSLKPFVQDTLLSFDVALRGKSRNFVPLAQLLFQTLYRRGGCCVVVDELQFASGRKSVEQALGHLLAMREFGLPVFAFANTDFVLHAMKSPGQIAQRVASMKQTVRPAPRGSTEFAAILEAQLSLLPFGHEIDVPRHALDIYDMVAGSLRGTARLIEVAAVKAIGARQPLRILDLVEAQRSSAFEIFADHTAILSTLHPVNVGKYPEFSSNNDVFDPREIIQRQLDEKRMTDAASVALFASFSSAEREAAQAAAVQIMRRAGKIPDNVVSVGESKRRRTPRKSLEQQIATSYAAEHLTSTISSLKRGEDDDKR